MRKGERRDGIETGAVEGSIVYETMQSDGDMNAEMNKRTVWMEQLEEDVRGPMRHEDATTR